MIYIRKKIRALLLFSSGLDSILAYKILQKQNIEVVAIFFKTYFWDEKKAVEIAKKLNINLRIEDIAERHFAIVKNPKFGYGKAMNPCIDCHILMLKVAKEIMEKEGFDFVATGEVLKERPFSQNIRALKLIEKESGLEGYLLRPLSAKLLKETIPEKLGWVNRDQLFNIQGRSRKKQIELAKEFNVSFYSTPAGGCLLTDLEFGKKLKWLLETKKEIDSNEIELLKAGRHFVKNYAKIIVGRDPRRKSKIKEFKKRKRYSGRNGKL